MIMKNLRILSGALVAFTMAHLGPLSAQVNRSQAPAPGAPVSLQLPREEMFKLSNGLEVYFIENKGLPLFDLRIELLTGWANEKPEQHGLAAFTADLLDEGAGNRTALQLAEELDFLAVNLGSFASAEYMSLSLSGPTAQLGSGMPLLADVLLRPTFSAAELARKQKEALVDLSQEHDQATVVARRAFSRWVAGENHPLGRRPGGTEATLKSFTPEAVKSWWSTYYRPENARVVAVVGGMGQAAFRALLEQYLGSWARGTVPAPAPLPAMPLPKTRTIYLVDKPGAAQSVIMIGRPAQPAGATPAHYAADVMNTLLGGSFTSRLNSNLREEHGYSYGASSRMTRYQSQGTFLAQSSVQTDVTDKAVKEFLNEFNRIGTFTPAELDKVRNYVALSYPSEFAGVSAQAEKLAERLRLNLPPDYNNTFTPSILAVQPAAVSQAAKTWVTPTQMVIVVVGDREKTEAGLKALKLGTVNVVKITDVLGPVPAVNP